jgi:sporulation protein YlmC with PRC-barrel domain
MQTRGNETMSKTTVVSFVVLLVGASPVAAQIVREQIPATSQIDKSLVGLPLVTSDGETVGYITEVGIDDGQAIAIGEIVRPLGIGYDAVAIPTEMFAHKGDHVELTIPAEEVRTRLKRPEK